MPEKLHPIIEKILSYENVWCKKLNIYNPYHDPWPLKISKNLPDFDGQAYRKYRNHNFVYDKLFIAKSQGIKCGKLEELIKEPKYLEFPIFIKPRWGNKSASSKNCYKINTFDQLKNYKHIPEMMWSEFINSREQMTDYFIHNGNIVHQITYNYSDSQKGVIADEWKFISPNNKPYPSIDNWVRENMKGYSGACNVQYRGNKIIEVGLRLARGGSYIYSTNNQLLISCINNLVNKNHWDYSKNSDDFKFKPYYSFKCYTDIPIIYLYPQYVLDFIMKTNNCKEFYEYYFEPSGSGLSMVCFQFLHEDFNKGIKIKKMIESLMNFAQILFFILYILAILIFLYYHRTIGIILLFLITMIFFTKIFNPLSMHVNLWNAQKQSIFS